MAAANDLEMVASMHVGSSSQLPKICSDAPFMANLTWGASRTSGTMLSWLFSGLFQRYPNLKIALSEGECGWMPVLPGARRAGAGQAALLGEARHKVHGPRRQRGRPRHARHPGDVPQPHLRLHHRGPPRVKSLAELGEDNIMCETDYPHSDSTWPNCIDVARNTMKDLPPRSAVQAAARQRRAAVPLHAGRAARPGERLIR